MGRLGAALGGLGADVSMATDCGVGYAIQATQTVGFVAQLANQTDHQLPNVTSAPQPLQANIYKSSPRETHKVFPGIAFGASLQTAILAGT